MTRRTLRNLLLMRQVSGAGAAATLVEWLARAEFVTPDAAPLDNPHVAEVGSWVTADTGSFMSIANGKRVIADSIGSGDPGLWDSLRTRAAGLFMVAEVVVSAANPYIGFDTDQAALPIDALGFASSSVINARVGGTNIAVGSYSAATSYKVLVIQRAVGGCLYLIIGGAFTNWTLLYVSATGTANLHAVLAASGTATVETNDFVRVGQFLAAPYSDDYGLTTAHLSGAQSAGQTFTHNADFLAYWTVTRPASGTQELRFRIQDATNYLQVTIDSTGKLDLDKVVAGVLTNLGTAAAAVGVTERIGIIAAGSALQVFDSTARRISVTDAVFATATNGKVEALGTSGAVTNLEIYARNPSNVAAPEVAVAPYAFLSGADIFVIAGQSNASGRGTNNQVCIGSGGKKAYNYSNADTLSELADPVDNAIGQVDSVSLDSGSATGSVWPLLATQIIAETANNVLFVPTAHGGTSITEWLPGVDHEDRSTHYGNMIYRARRAMAYGTLKCVVWWQGETDAIANMAQATYNGHLDTLANAVMADLGVPLMPCKLQNSSAIVDANELKINNAIGDAWTDNVNVADGPDFSDTGSDDDYHLQGDAKLLTAATRWFAALDAAGLL